MRRRLPTLIAFGVLACTAMGTDKAEPAKTVFHVSGLECGGCVYIVQFTLSQTPGVTEAEVIQQGLDGVARVSYDPKAVNEQQIAQAVRESPPVHGTPYIATMRLRVPGYSQDGNAAKVKALFDRWKRWVEVQVTNEHDGELLVQFLPLEKDAHASAPQGWSLARLTEVLQSPSPKGLGLKFEVLEPGPP